MPRSLMRSEPTRNVSPSTVWMGWLVGILLPEIRPNAEDCACFLYGAILYRPLGNRWGRLPDGRCGRCGCSVEGGDDSLIEGDQQRSQFF